MGINGRSYDHEDANVVMPSGLQYGTSELNYEDGQEIEAIYGRGAKPRRWGRKNYKSSGSMVMDRDTWEPLAKILAASGGGSIYDHKPFPIVCNYANPDLDTITDTLQDCKITKLDTSYTQGEANASQIKADFEILGGILWNGIPAKRNK